MRMHRCTWGVVVLPLLVMVLGCGRCGSGTDMGVPPGSDATGDKAFLEGSDGEDWFFTKPNQSYLRDYPQTFYVRACQFVCLLHPLYVCQGRGLVSCLCIGDPLPRLPDAGKELGMTALGRLEVADRGVGQWVYVESPFGQVLDHAGHDAGWGDELGQLHLSGQNL